MSSISKIDSKDNTPLPSSIVEEKSNISTLAEKTLQAESDGTTNYWLTSGNILRAELATGSAAATTASIASYLFYGAVAATVGPIIASILPVPLIAIAGYTAWQAYSTPDYDNTLEVSRYREEAKSLPLEESFKKHGKWVAERKILTQEQVTEKYVNETGKTHNIPDLLTYHQKIETLLKNTGSSYILPSPKENNQERFKKACISLNYDETVKLHGLANIFDWELFSPENLTETYLKKEQSLKGLPAICAFYETAENSRKQFDTQSAYTIPQPIRHQKKFQEDCATMSLKAIEKLHTLNYLFSWQLLTPKEFSTKYQEHVEHLFTTEGINSVIAYYKKTEELRNTTTTNGVSYEIPKPQSFSKRWMALDIPLERILFHHNMNELIEHRVILDPTYIALLKNLQSQFAQIQTNYKKSCNNEELEYTSAISTENTRFEKEEKVLELALNLLYEKRREQKLRIRDAEKELSIAIQNKDPVNIERLSKKIKQLQTENFLKGLFTTDPYTLNDSLNSVKSTHWSNIEQIQNRKATHLLNLSLAFTQEKRKLEQIYTEEKQNIKK